MSIKIKHIFLLFLFASIGHGAVQVDTAWVRRYDGPGNFFDCAYDIAVDDSGNVYVTGISCGPGTGNDYCTIKYDSHGDTLWIRRYHESYWNGVNDAFAMALDSSGNVIVTGMSAGPDSSYDYLTIKYSPDGVELWRRRYIGPAGGRDEASAIVADNEGNVYVTGRSVGPDGSDDFATTKYSSSGDSLWVSTYASPGNGTDRAESIAIDRAGNVYVTGRSAGDFAAIKYNSAGDTVWTRRFHWPGDGESNAHDIGVDSENNVYVTGSAKIEDVDFGCMTIKYSPMGDTLWVRRYDASGGYDLAKTLALDEEGNIYVGGYGRGGYLLIKYAPSGDSLWVRRHNGTYWGILEGLAVDRVGNAYMTGMRGGPAVISTLLLRIIRSVIRCGCKHI